MDNEKILIIDGARTPVGSFGGSLKDVPAQELGATAAGAAIARAGVEPGDIQEVVMGCIGQVGPDAYNARRVAMAAGLPDRVPAFTVNRLCGSGLQALWSAAMEMRWNGLDFTLAGGDESMSRMPFYDFDARQGLKLGHRTLVDGTVMMLTDPSMACIWASPQRTSRQSTQSPGPSRTSLPRNPSAGLREGGTEACEGLDRGVGLGVFVLGHDVRLSPIHLDLLESRRPGVAA